MDSRVLFDGLDTSMLDNPKRHTRFVIDNGSAVTLTYRLGFPFPMDFQILMVRGSDEYPIVYGGAPITIGSSTPTVTLSVPGTYVLDFPAWPVSPIDLVVGIDTYDIDGLTPDHVGSSGGGPLMIPPTTISESFRRASVSFRTFTPGIYNNPMMNTFSAIGKTPTWTRHVARTFYGYNMSNFDYVEIQPQSHPGASAGTYRWVVRPGSDESVTNMRGMDAGGPHTSIPWPPLLRSDSADINPRGLGLYGWGYSSQNGYPFRSVRVPSNVYSSFFMVGMA